MDEFLEILQLISKFHKELPEIRFGQLMHNLTARNESLFYLPDKEIIKRLQDYLHDDDYLYDI